MEDRKTTSMSTEEMINKLLGLKKTFQIYDESLNQACKRLKRQKKFKGMNTEEIKDTILNEVRNGTY